MLRKRICINDESSVTFNMHIETNLGVVRDEKHSNAPPPKCAYDESPPVVIDEKVVTFDSPQCINHESYTKHLYTQELKSLSNKIDRTIQDI